MTIKNILKDNEMLHPCLYKIEIKIAWVIVVVPVSVLICDSQSRTSIGIKFRFMWF